MTETQIETLIQKITTAKDSLNKLEELAKDYLKVEGAITKQYIEAAIGKLSADLKTKINFSPEMAN